MYETCLPQVMKNEEFPCPVLFANPLEKASSVIVHWVQLQIRPRGRWIRRGMISVPLTTTRRLAKMFFCWISFHLQIWVKSHIRVSHLHLFNKLISLRKPGLDSSMKLLWSITVIFLLALSLSELTGEWNKPVGTLHFFLNSNGHSFFWISGFICLVSGKPGPEPSPAFFTNLFQAMGLKQRRYKHGTYIPLNGQQMPKKPRSTSEEEAKIKIGGIGSMTRECGEGYARSRSGSCQRVYSFDEWKWASTILS